MSEQISSTFISDINYYAIFIDDATKITYITLMKNKSVIEMLKKFKEFKAKVKNQLDRKIKCFHTNEEEKYKKTFEKYLKEHEIIHETTVFYSFDQNDVNE
jgi:hypothetical protein